MENKEKKPQQVKRGLWKPEEDLILKNYVETHGEGNWADVSEKSGLMRGGKSCRLRWKNYLRPNLKRGGMSEEEEDLIIRMHKLLGNRWSLIAGRLPGRTDNEVKNYWNTHLNKKCQLGKRKTTNHDNCKTNKMKHKKQTNHLINSNYQQNTSAATTTQVLPEENDNNNNNNDDNNNTNMEVANYEGESIVTSTWMEDIRSFNYDVVESSVLDLPNNASLVFDDDQPIESPLVLPSYYIDDDHDDDDDDDDHEPSFSFFDSFLLF